VTLRGEETRTFYAQNFNQAYISSSAEGQYDVVLINDPASERKSAKPKGWKEWALQWPGSASNPGKPLEPLTAAALRQVVHLRVFWQAAGGSVAKDGVVTNAAIDWYVIAREESDRPEVLHYQGAGYVVLDEGRRATSVEIRDGSVRRTAAASELRDPVGPAQFRGTARAQRNTPVVRATIEELRAQAAAAEGAGRTAVSESR
jgi:hypothetical protein